MPDAVIVDAIRTPIGRAGKGSLRTVRADDLAAIPLRALIERNPQVDFAETNDVMMGAASSIGEQGYNVGRNAALLAGIDHHVPGCTVNRFCASSLQKIRMAFHAIKAGEGDQYIAAGVEAVSRAGLGAGMMDEAKHPHLNGSSGSAYDVYIPMGLTAENVARRCHVTASSRTGGRSPRKVAPWTRATRVTSTRRSSRWTCRRTRTPTRRGTRSTSLTRS
jgi:acetyl-CoA C-acetyltransferase